MDYLLAKKIPIAQSNTEFWFCCHHKVGHYDHQTVFLFKSMPQRHGNKNTFQILLNKMFI